jgi:hypothetical protein
LKVTWVCFCCRMYRVSASKYCDHEKNRSQHFVAFALFQLPWHTEYIFLEYHLGVCMYVWMGVRCHCLNGWTYCIHVWYLRLCSLGTCKVNMKIIAQKKLA